MNRTRISFILGLAVLTAVFMAAGCATKKYVKQETAAVDQKVQDVENAIEENQKRIKEHDERLTTLGTLITQQQDQIKGFDGKIEDVKKAIQGTLVSKEILKDDQAKFKFASAELGPEAQAVLDTFIERLVAENRGVYLEIQGHTDNVGADEYNQILGKKRADMVREYFYKKYHIPLHRMEAISYGSSVPLADNKTKDGRALNRRVEILVYE